MNWVRLWDWELQTVAHAGREGGGVGVTRVSEKEEG